ncbi:glycosyltransferase [Ramlibacter sp. MMS24-I3-19]|uniref:glycosyltransferase n=1 Tax=Ramlibacter sp. MMS24-I3-19 TaxID=3416606 RepID=UPI003CFFA92D
MKMKILYVVPPSTHFAGIERVVHDIASGLATRYGDRFDVAVLYCHRYAELSRDLPYKVIWKSVQRLRSFPFSVQSVLREQPCDIVVIAQFEPTALVWLWHRLCAGRTRFVMHLHGNPKKERSSSRRARFAFSFFNALLPRMHRIVAVSPGLARYVEEHVGPHARVEYLPNPVRQFSGTTRPAGSHGAVKFVTVGRLSWEKGHDVLVEAFAKVIARGLDARLTIVGDGAAQAELVAQIQRLGVGDRVRLTGKIPDPARELEQADCFVSASRWEGFGVSIVEALSAGLYVIASDCEFGPRDLIDCPEKGRIVMSEDPEALAAAMAEFVRSGRTQDHAAERREAAARFSLDHVIEKHAAMLESVGSPDP